RQPPQAFTTLAGHPVLLAVEESSRGNRLRRFPLPQPGAGWTRPVLDKHRRQKTQARRAGPTTRRSYVAACHPTWGLRLVFLPLPLPLQPREQQPRPVAHGPPPGPWHLLSSPCAVAQRTALAGAAPRSPLARSCALEQPVHVGPQLAPGGTLRF